MYYRGIMPGRPFSVNSKLSDTDRRNQLFKGKRLGDVTPYPDLTIIKMNSSYLEVVDKFYSWKGVFTAFVAIWIAVLVSFSLGFGWLEIESVRGGKGVSTFGAFAVPTLLLMAVAVFFLGRFEWAYYTHYPIRLNRARREVFVFRKDGSVLQVKWDSIFFTLGVDGRLWEIRGHVLGEDGETIKETFALGVNDSGSDEGMRKLRSHWEFFRRYMEEGPDSVAPYLKIALPIDGKRESFRIGYEVLASNFRHPDPVVALFGSLAWPFVALSSLGRWLAMQRSKVPRWPSDVELMSVVDKGDLYDVDSRINPKRRR